ncbi:MAG: molybdopterin-dependent oxidoreductase, partial [Hyphomicrobiaceae bacterium]|nr:molybdopterin-dependent oxidoreductase [Hyphomicrobiaceae bacterium]
DPRETATCAIADLHLAIKPGTDVVLFNGLLAHLSEMGRFDRDYIARYTSGIDGALGAAKALPLSDIAKLTELPASAIARFYELFAGHDRAVTVYSQGVNQSSAGTDKVNAIINCHLATGRIGTPGAGPFSVTGQPNAMGGREVGGLANMLAAHMDIENPQHRALVQEFWQSPRMPERAGLKVVDLFRAVGDGRIKALWIMATNPVDSLPEADNVRAALDACPFVVFSDVTAATDTAAFADVLLPAAAWGEKDGTVTNSERRISRQRGFLSPPGEAKPDWWHLAEVAKRLGYGAAFDYSGPADIFAEYAALTGYHNDDSRDLDLSSFASIAASTYDDMAPVQWPARRGKAFSTTRFFADGGFYTTDRRARFIATPYRPPASTVSPTYPLVLNTGRIRDQWHTMTRTAKTARLLAHIAEPFVEIHPAEARKFGLAPADLAIVESAGGRVIARVAVTERQRPGSVFVPMHWTAQYASDGRIGTAVAGNTDPVSGQPEAKYTPVRVAHFEAAWHAFAVTTVRPDITAFDYGAYARADGGYRVEAACTKTPRDWSVMAAALFGVVTNEADILSYQDRTLGHYRFAAFKDGRCVGMLYAGPGPVELSRSWAVDQLGREIAPHQRLGLLAGRPGCDVPDRGAIVCACFGVGQNEIVNAIVNGECRSVAEVGACLKAGTNCGSCRAEIGRLLNDARLEKAV